MTYETKSLSDTIDGGPSFSWLDFTGIDLSNDSPRRPECVSAGCLTYKPEQLLT